MTKPKVTIVTSAEMPDLFPGELPVLDELAQRGVDPQIKVWTDSRVDWSDAGLVVVRSVSDYASDRAAFLEWTKTIPRIVNSADVLEWNTDKHYLNELEALGMPVIPTTWLEPKVHLSKHQVHSRLPASGDFVVKPAVSSGQRDIGRYTANDTRQRQEAIMQAMDLLQSGRSVMIQRYLEEIDVHGETSLVFLNGLVSHAVTKKAMLHPAEVTAPEMHEAVLTGKEATEEEWSWGQRIRQVMHTYVRNRIGRDDQFLFCRIDVVPDGKGSFMVMEVGAVDADLYLESTPTALTNFADAIAMRAFW